MKIFINVCLSKFVPFVLKSPCRGHCPPLQEEAWMYKKIAEPTESSGRRVPHKGSHAVLMTVGKINNPEMKEETAPINNVHC